VSLIALFMIAGAILVAAGGVLCLGRRLLAPGLTIQAIGLALVGAGGVFALRGGSVAGSPFSDGVGLTFGVDPLTGFFLAALAVSGIPAAIFAASYLAAVRGARAVGVLTAGFLLALIGVLTARTALGFLTFWELMTLLPAGTILIVRRDPQARRSVFEYLAITHLGGVGVWVSLLLLANTGALGHPAGLLSAGAPLQALIALAAIVGFGTKAGIMPFHSWLPRAHPLAPSHVSALMSGMMIKVALYGLIRVLFEWLDVAPTWLALLLLVLGTLSALGGVIYALFQHELKRLLAFHSIENIGIIVLGLGASLLFQSQGQPLWAAFAFAAALLHVLNHAVFKSLLFLGAGSIDRAVHGLELDRLGGLLRRMPWTGGAFLIGSMAIAGLPPLNGFVSEWLTLQGLVHVVTGPGRGEAGLSAARGASFGPVLVGALATAGLAMTAALAVFCFAKVVGLVLLGPARRPACATAREVPWPMIAATTTLAGLCVALGLVPSLLLPSLAGLAPGGDSAARLFANAGHAALLPWNLGVALPGTGGLPTLGLGLILAGLVAVLALVRGRRRAAAAPVWACGQKVEPALLWSSAGFTKPLRLVLEALLRPERTVTLVETNGVAQRLTYRGSVPHLFDTLLYRPVVRSALAAATIARRLQSGSLRAYVGYLLALVIGALALAWLWGVR
jgi:hydrogenase-4 component B